MLYSQTYPFYVLLFSQVGPKQKEFSVKDKENYDFKPQETVSNISAIYLNLKDSDQFCQAVFQDQRSYTPELFKQVKKFVGRHSDMIKF